LPPADLDGHRYISFLGKIEPRGRQSYPAQHTVDQCDGGLSCRRWLVPVRITQLALIVALQGEIDEGKRQLPCASDVAPRHFQVDSALSAPSEREEIPRSKKGHRQRGNVAGRHRWRTEAGTCLR